MLRSKNKKENSLFFKSNEWWYRIAWAFLPIKSSDGSFNIGRKLRLQLFKPVTQKIDEDAKGFQTTEVRSILNTLCELIFTLI